MKKTQKNTYFSHEMRLYDDEGSRLYVNSDERERFLAAAKDETREYRVLCGVYVFTGCRLSEALEITADRVNLVEENIRVRTLKKRKLDRNGKKKKPHFRPIPVPPELLNDIDLVFDIKKIKRTKVGLNKPLWNVTSMTIYRMIKRVMKRANIEGPHATPKGLRHGFGIAMAPHMPLTVLRDAMGHTSTDTTEIYLQYVGDEKKKLILNAWNNQL